MIKALFIGLGHDPRRLFRLLLAGGLLILTVLDLVILGTASVPAGSLRLELRSTVRATMRVYFDTGAGFVTEEGASRVIAAGPQTQTLLFPLPPVPVRNVRIDPMQGAGLINLHSVSVVRDEDGGETQAFEVESLVAKNEIRSLTPDNEGLEIVPVPGAADPQLRLPLERPITLAPTVWRGVAHLALLDAALLSLFAAAGWVAIFGWPRPALFTSRRDNLRGLATRWFPNGWSALLFAFLVAAVLGGLAVAQRNSYYLEAEVTCDGPIVTEFYFDPGEGNPATEPVRVDVPASPDFRRVRFPISVGTLEGLRFHPAQGPVRMRVNSFAVRSDAEDWLGGPPFYSFDLRNLWPVQQLTELVHEEDGTIRLLATEGQNDPAAKLELPDPLTFRVNGGYVALRTLFLAFVGLLVWIAVVEVWTRLPPEPAARAAACVRRAWRRLTPAQAVWLVAAASVGLSSYPVIFCGKSFVGVNFQEGTYQLYQKFPTLPGTTDARLASGHGADVGVMAWQTAPNTALASRQLFRHGELPLWNRFSGGGSPLLGQGQSMVGDPLHWLVLLAGGRAWAWDMKFLLAKLCFAAGIGLLVLTATACLPAALLLSFSAAFIGFWAFRLNHPAYFSLCYAPWILFAWAEIVRATTWRRLLGWTIGLVLIDWTELNSGSMTEAFASLWCLNLTGLLLLLLARRPVQFKFQRLLVLGAGGLIFFLLAAPVLLAYLDALGNSVHGAGAKPARHLPPGLLIGLFDDIFPGQLAFREAHLGPSANFLVLCGVLLALSHGKRLLRDRLFVGVSFSAALLLALVYQRLPLAWCGALSLAGAGSDPDAAFSTVLLVYLFVVAGFGLRQCLQPSRRRWLGDALVAALLGAVLLDVYFEWITSPASASLAVREPGQVGIFSAFFGGYAALLVLATVLLPFALRRLWLRGPELAPALLLACCVILIHWRFGLQLPGRFDRYTPQLPDRPDLLARSPALDFLHADQATPFRGVGLGANLMPGYNEIAGVESFDSADPFVSPYLLELKTIGMKMTHVGLADLSDKERLAQVKRLYDLGNVRYYLTLPGDNLSAVPGLRLIGNLDLDVYRNETAWPRAFFVDRLQEYDGGLDYVREVMEGDSQPFAAIDVSEYVLVPSLVGRFDKTPLGRTVIAATNYRLDSNRTTFDIDAPSKGVIVLTETFYSHATFARINGHPAPVFRVNHAFRGVLVDHPGHYHLSFTYHPAHFILSLYGAVLGWGLLAAAGWWLWRVPVARWIASVRGATRRRLPPSFTLAKSASR